MSSPYSYLSKISLPTTYSPPIIDKNFIPTYARLGMHSNSFPPTMTNWVYPSWLRYTLWVYPPYTRLTFTPSPPYPYKFNCTSNFIWTIQYIKLINYIHRKGYHVINYEHFSDLWHSIFYVYIMNFTINSFWVHRDFRFFILLKSRM